MDFLCVLIYLRSKGIIFIRDREHRHLPITAQNKELQNCYVHEGANEALITGAKPELLAREFSGTTIAFGQCVKEDAQLFSWHQTAGLSLNRDSSLI